MSHNSKRQTKFTVLYTLLVLVTVFLACCAVGCAPKQPPTELSQPQNLRIEGRKLYWDQVENADGYILYIDNDGYETKNNVYDLMHLLQTDKTYVIKLMAYSYNSQFIDSDYAQIEYTPKEILEEGYDESGLQYKLLEDGTGYEVFRGNVNLVGTVVIPDYFCDLPVKRIGEYAFTANTYYLNPFTNAFCNTKTTAMKLPKYLESIAKMSMACIVNLKELVIPDTVTEIGLSAFWGNRSMTKVTLPKNLKEIPNLCFGDTGLAEITLPQGLEKIGDWAFYCQRITDLNYPIKHIDSDLSELIIPDTVTSIGDSAFRGRNNLRNIKMSANVQDFGIVVFDDTPWLDEHPEGFLCFDDILYTYKGNDSSITVPDNVKRIAGGAFRYQENLKSVYIPDGISFIGYDIFWDCNSLEQVRLPQDLKILPIGTFAGTHSLRHIDLPNSLVEIGKSAFYDSGLEQLTIPDSVKTLRGGFINDCSQLRSLTIGKNVSEIGTIDDCFNLREIYNLSDVKLTMGERFSVAQYAKAVHTSLDEKSNFETDENGFIFYNDNGEYELISYDKSKPELVLPDNYKGKPYSINYAFHKDRRVEKVVIPETFSELPERAFYYCENLKEVVLPNSMKEIKSLTFYYCSSLVKVTLGKYLTTIGSGAFSGCSNLETVTYENCSALEKAAFPDSLLVIERSAFLACKKLTTINLGNGIETIGLYAFDYCSGIVYILIPKSLKESDRDAFGNTLAYPLFFRGTKAEFEKTGPLVSLVKSFRSYFYSEIEPPLNEDGTAYDGQYWHYDSDGKTPIIWEKN